MTVTGKISTLFFFSGVSTLIYQIAWQHWLLTSLDGEVESSAIMFVVFMASIGLGALCGGLLADKYPSKLLGIFILFEFVIAVFGFASPDLINFVNQARAGGLMTTAINSLVVMGPPTFLVGALFPVLVKYVNDSQHHIGHTVSILYGAVTLGGAFGAFITAFFLLTFMDLVGVIACAALLNLVVAGTTYVLLRRDEQC